MHNENNPLRKTALACKAASIDMLGLDAEIKNAALEALADALLENSSAILEANSQDAEQAREALEAGRLSSTLYKRLLVDESKLQGMADGLRSIARLDDPVGKVQEKLELDEGLILTRVSTPLGLLGIIFESRPDVVPQVVGLSVKSSNTVIFKGGSEAAATNRALFELLYSAGLEAGLPEKFSALIETREDVAGMLELDDCFDLIIPRGSNELVRSIMENTRVPVLGHADGICSMYIDKSAGCEMAVALAVDAKTQYPAVCNAIENLLIHRDIAGELLPVLDTAMMERGVEMRGDSASLGIVPSMKPATDLDWATEYNDLVLSVKVAASLEEAVSFINRYGSGHTDAIVTESQEAAAFFQQMVDSSSVMVNASTRFADGFRYGKGAEVGISTNKIHARGPVGLEGLLIYKYLLNGAGHTVTGYSGKNGKSFTHRRLR